MRNKAVLIAVFVTAALLLVSMGIAVAASQSGDSANGPCPMEGNEARLGSLGDEDACTLRYRNAGEDSEARNMICAGQEDAECEGDCDRVRDRDRLQDGSCDGECDGNGAGNGNCPNATLSAEVAGAGSQACTGARQGECAGDCDRDQTRLQDGSCDGTCDGSGK